MIRCESVRLSSRASIVLYVASAGHAIVKDEYESTKALLYNTFTRGPFGVTGSSLFTTQ